VGIADYYTWACIYGMFSPAEGFPKVHEFASKALELDPMLAEAHAAIGLYHSNMQEWEKAEQYYRRAIDLNPSYPLSHEWLAAVLVGTGRFKEGSHEVLLAEHLDPLSLRPKVLSAWTLYETRDFDAALAKAREIQSLSGAFMQTYLQLANILTEVGTPDEALQNARAAAQADPESPLPIYPLCFALVKAGLPEEATELLAKWTEIARSRYVPPYFLGMMNLALGNIDEALTLFEAARDERSAWVLWYGTEPKLDAIRSDPRFSALVESLGLPRIKF
jgi:tetratricopeptide (TPR) repeat protein